MKFKKILLAAAAVATLSANVATAKASEIKNVQKQGKQTVISETQNQNEITNRLFTDEPWW